MNLTQEVASLLVYFVIALAAGWAATLVTAYATASVAPTTLNTNVLIPMVSGSIAITVYLVLRDVYVTVLRE